MRLQLLSCKSIKNNTPMTTLCVRRNHKLAPLLYVGGFVTIVTFSVPALCAGSLASSLMINLGFAPFGVANLLITTTASVMGAVGADLFWTLILPAMLGLLLLMLIMAVPISVGYGLSKFYTVPNKQRQQTEVKERE